MSEWVTCEVKGLSELQSKLEGMQTKMAKRGIRAALKAGGNVIRNAMMMLAPKATGFLASHFGTKVSIRRDSLAGTAFIGPQGKMDYPALNGASGPLRLGQKARRIAVATVARFLEFGTRKMGAKPFMTQAFEGYKDTALEAMTEELREAVQPD